MKECIESRLDDNKINCFIADKVLLNPAYKKYYTELAKRAEKLSIDAVKTVALMVTDTNLISLLTGKVDSIDGCQELLNVQELNLIMSISCVISLLWAHDEPIPHELLTYLRNKGIDLSEVFNGNTDRRDSK